MRERLHACLEICRVPMAPSAVSDSYAGLLIAALHQGLPLSPLRVLAVAGTSLALYSFGMVTNDLLDASKDRRLAPHRPLPSGRISPRGAVALSTALAAAGITLAFLLGVETLAVMLVLLALLYNSGAKKVPFAGSIILGACRGANLLVGAAAMIGTEPALADPRCLAGASVLLLYTSGITSVSRLEEEPFSEARFRLRSWAVRIIPLSILIFRPLHPLVWIHAAVLFGALSRIAESALGTKPPPRRAALFVAGSLGAVPILDAGLVLALLPPPAVGSPSGPHAGWPFPDWPFLDWQLPDWPLSQGSQVMHGRLPPLLAFYALFALAWAWRRARLSRGREGS